MKKKKLAWWFADYAIYGYDDAYNQIKENLEAPTLVDQAFLDFYYENIREVDGKKMKAKDRKESVTKIIDKYNEKMAAEIKKEMREKRGLAPVTPKTVDALLKENDATMDDIEAAAKQFDVTTDEVIRRMREKSK